jgi:dihydrofolate synthase/folylpolyglutamate synthase
MLPMYQNVGKVAFKKDLTNTKELLKFLNNPENKGKYIHVTGSNGKGSVSSILASVLSESGYKVGLYTSPHLLNYKERIRINGECVTEEFVIDFVEQVQTVIEEINPSFFELTVAMAFSYFAKEKTDINIIEVGMGGRLDSTNVILPELSIITNISLEHTDMLGESLAEIASEKAGIIKQNTPVVIGESLPETEQVFVAKCKEMNAKAVYASAAPLKWIDLCELKGIYQTKNLATVQSAIALLQQMEWEIDPDSIRLGLKNIMRNTGLMGRWQCLGNNPLTYADTAHNEDGFKNLALQLNSKDYNHIFLVLGVVEGKSIAKMLSLLPSNITYHLCKPNVVRGMNVVNLAQQLDSLNLNCQVFNSPEEAYSNALNMADTNDLVLVTGSNFLVADILSFTKYGQ